MDLAEAAGCPCAPAQMVAKTFNCVLNSYNFPDDTTKECKQKTSVKKLGKLQTNFSAEVRYYQQNQGMTAKSTHNIANSANQKFLKIQDDFRQLIS